MISIKDKKIRDYIISYKRARGCQFCGYNKCVSALDFHHIGNSKEFSISQSSNLKKIKKEITKCVVLCKNCHAGLHEREKEGPGIWDYNKINIGGLEKVLLTLTGQFTL